MKYKLFGNTGLRVSELCLGTMTFGIEWGTGTHKVESQKIFDHFVDQGGNFFDTANRYTEGTSEKWLGQMIGSERERFVISTKYSLYDDPNDINSSGNHRKNLFRSVNQSLKRLGTDYIDILWLHMWDYTTPVDQIMRALDDLVRLGKVHHVGISDTPAWVISQAITLAKEKGWTAFAGLQVEYSLIERTVERELIPMAKELGLTITPWSPLGAGILTGKYNEGFAPGSRLTENSTKYNEQNLKIAQTLEQISIKLKAKSSQVALAWLKQKHPSIIPIIGARKLPQLKETIGCLDISIPLEYVQQLDEISKIDLGFPYSLYARPNVQNMMYGNHADRLEF